MGCFYFYFILFFFSNLFVPWLSVSGTEYPAEGGTLLVPIFLTGKLDTNISDLPGCFSLPLKF